MICKCGAEMVPHRSAGKGRYGTYPNMHVCPECWRKADPDTGQQISRTGKPMGAWK